MIDDAELEEKAEDCLTVEQKILSLERDSADAFKEIATIEARGYHPHQIGARNQLLMHLRKAIEHNRLEIGFLREFG